MHFAAVVLVAGVGVLIWQPWKQAALSPAMQQEDSAYVRTVVLSKGALEETVSATGTVESNEVSTVTTSLTYSVKSVEVQVGDEVAAGDIICMLDTSELTTRLQKAQETLQESIDQAYEQAEKNYSQASETYQSCEEATNSAKDALDTAKKTVQLRYPLQ